MWWVRGLLIAVALVFATVLYVATRVQPYSPDGTALRMASHESLGLPPCRFREMFHIPCPSCGMTTSFALLVRGDFANAARANFVGLLMAIFCVVAIPWCIISGLRGRYLILNTLEGPLIFIIGSFTVLMLLRWGIVLLIES